MEWTDQQEEDLCRVWLSKTNLKRNLHLFGGRSYGTVVNHAHFMKLGPRPHSDRGVKPFAKDVVFEELRKKPGTVPELSERTRLTRGAVNRYLTPAKAGKMGEYHICDWRRRAHGGQYVPVYQYGPGENAEPPKPRSNAELCRYKRDRHRMSAIAQGERPRFVNPFAAAAGLVKVPSLANITSRVYRQSMEVRDDEMEVAA